MCVYLHAESLYQQVKEVEDCKTFAETNGDSATIEEIISKQESDKNLVDAAFSLKKGEMSEVVEGDRGYYIIYCVDDNNEEALEQAKEDIILAAQIQIFENQYEEWAKMYEVKISEKLWETSILSN